MGDAGFAARLLLREAREGALATAATGEPQLGLVTPATDETGNVLLLLSGLSAHTKALEAASSCALLVTGRRAGANPQMTPRVSINGHAEKLGSAERASARARYLAVHPYAALYVDFDDFSFWRIRPDGALHVAGFGRARKLGSALRPSSEAVGAIEAARPALLADACRVLGEVVGLDLDGIDVADGEATVRRSFDMPATDPDDWRAALGRLTTTA